MNISRNKEQPDLSIVIVNWNTRDLLLKCIGTILADAGVLTLEIIVVDNGSQDGSARAVMDAFPQVTLIRNSENLGFARANNIGINAARGRYLCLSNSDIEVIPGCLTALVIYMEDHGEAGIIGPKTLNIDRSLRKNCKTFPTLRRTFNRALGLHRLFPRSVFFGDVLMLYFAHDRVAEVDVLPGCFLMVRRSAMEKVGPLDDRFFIYGEDKDWCRRFKLAGWKVMFFPDAEVIHLAGKSAAVAPLRFMIERLKANEYYWLKHHGPLHMRLYLGILILHHGIRSVGGLLSTIAHPASPARRWQGFLIHAACTRWIVARLLFNTHTRLITPSRTD